MCSLAITSTTRYVLPARDPVNFDSPADVLGLRSMRKLLEKNTQIYSRTSVRCLTVIPLGICLDSYCSPRTAGEEGTDQGI